MYLERLNRREKEMIIELAFHGANYNKDFSKPQQNLIENYKREMDLAYYRIEEKEFEDIVSVFDNDVIRNTVFLEIFALILSDNKFDNEEQDFIKKLQTSFSISDAKRDKFQQWIQDFIKLFAQGQELINS